MTVVRMTTTIVRTTKTAASTATVATQSMCGLTQNIADPTRASVHERLALVQHQGPVHQCNNKSVPPQGLIPNLKRKPTPSVASTSSGTSTTSDPNYEAPAPNTGSNTSVEADSRPRS
jgi:hypothetical protein